MHLHRPPLLAPHTAGSFCAAVLAAPLVLCPPTLPAQAPPLHEGIPPAALAHGAASAWLVPGPGWRASYRLDMPGRRVTLLWSYAPDGDHQTAVAAVEQELAVAFWPTAAAAVAPSTLLVAGKERSGATRIERWTVVPPLVALEPSGGTVLTPRALDGIEPVFEASDPATDMVRAVLDLQGSAHEALVLFEGSHTLHRLDWANEPYPHASVLTPAEEPGLAAAGFDHYQWGDHSDHGYVYVLSDEQELGTQTPPLVLFDYDRDGTLDASSLVPLPSYHQLGLSDRSRWIELNGLPVQ